MPEIGGLAFGFSQHDDLLLGQGGGQRRVFLPQQEVIVGPGHSCRTQTQALVSRELDTLLDSNFSRRFGLVDKGGSF